MTPRSAEAQRQQAVEPLENGYGLTNTAQMLAVDAGQVTIDNIPLIDAHLERIAAAPSAGQCVSDAGITTPKGTFVAAAELNEVRDLQAQNPATRNADGTPTPFGAAIGKRGTSVRDKTAGLNHVGRALGMEMIEAALPQGEIKTALGIGNNGARQPFAGSALSAPSVTS